MGYPVVQIYNSTNFTCKGTVHLASIFCSNDDYTVMPLSTWTEGSRGVCLVTEISATVYLPDGSQVQATPYESSGTSYSQYSIIQQGPKNFTVTRVVSLADDLGVIDQPEPTENQK